MHIDPPNTIYVCYPSIFAYTMQEDPWNSIAAGALTGGILQLRTGLPSAARSAAFGGVLLVRVCRQTMFAESSCLQQKPHRL